MLAENLPCIQGYDVKEQVGKGGFGEVYRAVQPGLNRVVAIS